MSEKPEGALAFSAVSWYFVFGDASLRFNVRKLVWAKHLKLMERTLEYVFLDQNRLSCL